VELLEREAALAELIGLAGRARAGDGQLALVAGEAGVGKTALVECLQREVPDARWSWSACDGLFTPLPLGPLFDLASHRGRTVAAVPPRDDSPGDRAGVPGHRRGPIHARILAALASLGCADAARMAFHAEAAGDGPAVLRHALPAARRAAALGAHH
jgi:hypothetical protein